MVEIWLRTNSRLALAAAAAALVISVSSGVVALEWIPLAQGALASSVAWGICAAAAGGSLFALWCARRPRLAYADGMLRVYLRPGPAIRLPIEIVECFLMGRAPSYLPRPRHANEETSTVVVRLRPQAAQWSQVDVEPRLGSWCDSRIMIRGTWCEPISIELLHELNRRLALAQHPQEIAKGPE